MAEAELPIDIHWDRLLGWNMRCLVTAHRAEWMIDRKWTPRTWSQPIAAIRESINHGR